MKTNLFNFCVFTLLLGLCLEKLPVSSSTSNLHVDREQDVITCYEKAGDIALLYLQEIERVSKSHTLIPTDCTAPSPMRPHPIVGVVARKEASDFFVCLWARALLAFLRVIERVVTAWYGWR